MKASDTLFPKPDLAPGTFDPPAPGFYGLPGDGTSIVFETQLYLESLLR